MDIQKKERPYPIAVLGFLGVILSTMFWSIVFVVARLLFFPQKLINRGCSIYTNMLLLCGGGRLEIRHKEFFNDATPCVVVSNHSSLLDIPAVFAATSGSLRMLSKREIFFIPFMGWAMWANYFVSINRGNSKSGQKAVAQLTDRLRRGFHIFLAPEGTRSTDGALLPFKKGAFRIAMEHKVPLVALVLEKPWELMPKKASLLPRYSGIIYATFVGRIEPKDFPSTPEELSEKVRQLMLQHGLKESLIKQRN